MQVCKGACHVSYRYRISVNGMELPICWSMRGKFNSLPISNQLQKVDRIPCYAKKLEEGRTVTSVAAEFGINKSVVSRAWKAFQTTGTAVRMVGGGRPRTTTAGDDRYIILKAKRGRRKSASVIAQQLSTATGLQVSWFTVARRLHKRRLFAHRPEHCLPLKVDHRRHRLQW
ncbi:transposable element Tcb2 transposase [Trichonephila clavipes]|nr:transposable element Tcb2 transposase [Trichonephila clavipes]